MKRLGLAPVLFAGVLAMSCKVNLDQDTLTKGWHSYQDAKKDLSPENEYYVGRSVTTNLLSRANYKYVESDSFKNGELGKTTAYVNAVGNVLAAAAMGDPRKDDRPSPIAGWHFVIVDDDQINAFAASGGFIVVNKGLVKAARNEDELAAVLAHEVAHTVRGHAIGSIKKARMAGVYKEMLDSSVQLDAEQLGTMTKAFEGAMDDMIDSMTVKGYSRDTEFEADRVGLKIMVDAGYDPQAFLSLLEQVDKKLGNAGTGGMKSTHPAPKDRIEKIKAELAKYEHVKVPKARTERFKTAIAQLDAGGGSAGKELE
ncbi:MAG TPA: M48 family metalloprotease [Kofleriaceae bacterium]|nr:M48 family metalloprotease [Kofleriaceae bacterium]